MIMLGQIKTDSLILKKFGFLLGTVFALVSLVIFIKHGQVFIPGAIGGLLFTGVAIFAPLWLKYFYLIWMRFAYGLSWINTRILLAVIFYGVFTPLGLLMRLCGFDPLERKFNTQAASYWKAKNAKTPPTDYHRQA